MKCALSRARSRPCNALAGNWNPRYAGPSGASPQSAGPRKCDWRRPGSPTDRAAFRSPQKEKGPIGPFLICKAERSGAGLLDHAQIGAQLVPAFGKLFLGLLIGDGRHDDHVVAV